MNHKVALLVAAALLPLAPAAAQPALAPAAAAKKAAGPEARLEIFNHSDPRSYGHLSAVTWLARHGIWRAENPARKSTATKW